MASEPVTLYLELMKRCVLGLIYEDIPIASFADNRMDDHPDGFQRDLREAGLDWPSQAHSMIGLKRMENLQHCVETALEDDVPGDLIETGVWRGGATIFMRGILKAHGVHDRTVWVADSFAGLPRPNTEEYPEDVLDFRVHNETLAIPLETVKENFQRYGLLDDQVRFLVGWFKETLPGAPIRQLAVLRLDGDLYESTIDALSNLYPKLSPGGFCIIDDFCIGACVAAVEDYRRQQGISEKIVQIDDCGAFWRRGG